MTVGPSERYCTGGNYMKIRCWLLAAIAIGVIAHVQTEAQSVWQIGKFDSSPVEFHGSSGKAVSLHVGVDDALKVWPSRQETGATYQILFPLQASGKAYALKIAALIEAPRVPSLRIEVNGRAGNFYLHPKISYSRSDFSYAFDPHESQSTITVDIPKGFLKAGENTIAITCVDDPATPKTQEEIGSIDYDALSLEERLEAGMQSAFDVEPTIFFHQAGVGLTEVVDAYLRFAKPWRSGTAELAVGGKKYDAKLAGGEFGEERVSFDVAEWQGAVAGKLRANGEAKHISLAAQRKWNVFVVPHTHLDVGFTDYQGKVAEIQARVLTEAASLIHQYPEFRFSMDGSWNLEQLLRTRPETKRKEILDLIRSGKMAMPVQYCNLLTGYASLETLYRSLYQSKEIANQYGLPFEYANITDVPTYSGSYPSILADSGVKYWVAAANNDRAPVFFYKHWNEKSPFWWEGPDGKKVLFWYSRHYMQLQTLFGLPPQIEAARESLPIYLQAYSAPTYVPDAALIYGTQVENTDLFPSTATFATEWNKQYAYPKMTYSTFPDFFNYINTHFANDLPTVKGDGGGYWEDGVGSDAFYAAEDRSNQNRALSAEILSSAMHSVDSNLNAPDGMLADIWRNIVLFSEHTWLSYNSVSQPDHEESVKQLRVKDDRAERASLEIEDVTNRSLSQLADQIHIPENTLVVFNSLNWKRDAFVELDLSEHTKLVDLETNEAVPLQILAHKEEFLHVRFLAKNLPPVGYKCFAVSEGKENNTESHAATGTDIENSYYKIVLDPESGAVRSIFDKQLQRELVDANSPYKFGQYLYVTGGDGDTQMVNPFPSLPPGDLTVHPSSGGKIARLEHTDWGDSILLQSSAQNTPSIETEILLFKAEKKIEFRLHIRKDYTNNKEAVYVAFPVAAKDPVFHFATQQDWVNPAKDMLTGASLEWFNVQQWMAAGDNDFTVGVVPVDTPLASFGDINRGKWPGEFHPATGTLFSYAMNNYWHTNYRAGEGGEFTFRYAMTSGPKFNGSELTKLGFEEMRPAEMDYVESQDKAGNPERPLPPQGASFLTVHGSNVALVTWKRAENGHGSIVRLQETGGAAGQAAIQFLRTKIARAHLCTGVEDDLRSLDVNGGTVTVALKPHEVVTLRLETE